MPIKTGEGAREVTQQLRVLTALAEDLGLISSIYLWLTTVCNSWSRRSGPSSEFLRPQAQTWYTYIHASKTVIYEK